jgi:outer membrane protein assembly factor BamB
LKRAITIAMAVVLGVGGFVSIGADAANLGPGTCAPADHPGGEWRSYGGGLANQRNQTAETTLNPSTVANVAKAWTFDIANDAATGVLGGTGTLQNTPVVADGCVYLSTSQGFVLALNADTGERVWTSPKMDGGAAGSLVGGVITGSPTVVGGVVYVGVSRLNDPFVAALNQATGEVKYLAPVMDPNKKNPAYRTTIVAAPVVWNGLIFQGIMADEGSAGARGGYAILDAATGTLIRQEFTISDAEYAAGYRGASVWCTAALDAETGYAYACGGNPASKQLEARYSNSLLKIDLDRSRPTFGQIVAAYKGNFDHYYPGLDRQPVCEAEPADEVVWSPTCVQLDLDFGASPSLFTVDVAGQSVKVVGDLQKAGIYHAAFADNMQLAWSAVVGAPGPVWNASSPAVDGSNVYVAGTPPAQVWGLSKDRGGAKWVTPLPTGAPLFFESVSTANGVVYTVDNAGIINMLDAATGVPAKVIAMASDVGGPVESSSSHGISIARNTIYAAASSFVVAYR